MAGLKTLAKELQSKGRNGDTILAHINPQEAGILKALGGSGTRNPDTGLPEYRIGKIFKPFQQAAAFVNPFNPGSGLNKGINQIPIVGDVNKAANKLGTQIFQPIEKAIVQPASRGLADFEKQVNKTIPGGYATLGQIALAVSGAPVPLQVAYGAARGSGVMRKGGNFNLQGAVIGGATAYAQAKLGEYLQGAAPPGTESTTDMATLPVSASSPEVFAPGLPSLPAGVDPGYFDVAPTALSSAPSVGDFAGSFSDPTAGMAYSPPNVSGYDVGGAGVPSPARLSFLDKVGTGTSNAISDTVKYVTEPTKAISEAARTGEGIGNLLTGGKSLSTVDPIKMGALALYGETSLAGLDEQRKYLEESKRANAISQAEYDSALAEINRQRDYAQSVVNQSPFNPNPSRDVSIGETFYGRSGEGENLYDRMQSNLYANQPSGASYAMGGQVDDELGGDYSAIGMDQGNLQKGLFGLGYAAGGMPRFLSGGGDGMSDSIKASINGTQEARLADGEFVIPADVVSHLGNGSSKAGAKQLYSMMDKIRKARTGNPKQGKQINPRKYLPA
jgi:hypothetical protein